MDEHKKYKLKTTVFFVEVNTFEKMQLKKRFIENFDENMWEEESYGFSVKAGEIKIENDEFNKPIVLVFEFVKLFNQRICFYEIISRYNDVEMVNKWIIENSSFKNSPYIKKDIKIPPITDSMGFNNVIIFCKRHKNTLIERIIKLYNIKNIEKNGR